MLRIGVDMGGTKIEGVLLGDDGSVRERIRISTPRDDYDASLRSVVELIRRLEAGTGVEPPSVGIGMPGAISPATGLVKNSNSVRLNGRPLAQDLERLLGRSLRLANDADCFTLSEAVDGAGQGASIVFGVILGTGVGGGIAVNGALLAGPNAISGEWGHNPLPWPRDDERPGPPCYCGKTGCIETFLSGPGLARDHLAVTGGRLDAVDIVVAAAEGDEAALATMARFEERLARALAGVINLLDPTVIVLGGGLSKIARLYQDVPQQWQQHVFSDRVDTRLLPPVHGDSGGVRGAAWLW